MTESKGPLLLSFIAPTGYGKSTLAAMVQTIYRNATNLKLATPLYEIQDYFYRMLGIELGGAQDGELLQFLGAKVQTEAPDFLADTFEAKLAQISSKYGIITNDDCRAHNYQRLKDLGFIFVRIVGISRTRSDRSLVDPCHSVEQGLEHLNCDVSIDNSGDMDSCKNAIQKIIDQLMENGSLIGNRYQK